MKLSLVQSHPIIDRNGNITDERTHLPKYYVHLCALVRFGNIPGNIHMYCTELGVTKQGWYRHNRTSMY